MPNNWFESVAVARQRAERRLPRPVAQALHAGAEAGTTLDDNLAAYRSVEVLPVTADQPDERSLATKAMGFDLSFPLMISPTGVQAVHPDGELAVARAAAARGVAMGLSSFASTPLPNVVQAQPNTMFQLYWAGDRSFIADRVAWARESGAKGLIVTLDWSFSHGRDWGSPEIPQQLGLREMVQHAPAGLARPRWLADWLRSGRLPTLGVPNMAPYGERVPGFFEAYGSWMATPPPTWDDIEWLRSIWDGPFMVKGVMRLDEARNAHRAGATAISVSNHGGNNLDGTPSPLRVLASIASALGDEMEIITDSGVRRGSDIVKAVALGARAVMIGRAYLWGLAANGQAGVENVLDVLRSGADATMRGIGVAKLSELSIDDLVLPPDFHRTV